MKKVSVLIISLLIAFCSFIPAFADEVNTNSYAESFSFNFNNEEETEEYNISEETSNEEVTDEYAEENATEISETEDTSVPDLDEIMTMTADDLENYTSPAEEEPEEIPSSPYTTITVKGLKSKVIMTLKNTETGEKFKIELNRQNEFTTRFEGSEGTYKISLKTNEVSVRAGKIFNDKKQVVKTIEIKRVNNWQNIILNSSIRPTFNIFLLLKKHWLIISLFAGVNIAYYVVKKHRVLPSKPL